jgi:hypothetical protein
MAANDTMTPRPRELLRSIGEPGAAVALYREAYSKGMSLSAYLEVQDPSEEYKDNLDSFGRCLRCADVKVNSIPEQGVWADTYEKFYENPETRALIPEWYARQWRRASTGKSVLTREPYQRAIYTSADNAPGSWMFPYADAAAARVKQLAPPIPLAEIVALTTPIDTDSYRAYYLTDSATAERRVRISEGADIPTATLTGADHIIKLHKYGRALEASYEMLRRQRIDRVALHVARMAIQTEMDKVDAAMGTLINGDGNSNGATNYNLSAMDPAATLGTVSLKGWLNFKIQFYNPYVLTAVLVLPTIALNLFLLNTGTANIPISFIQQAQTLGTFSHINPTLQSDVRIGWTPDAAANIILGLDTRWALEEVNEIGANITEIERFVLRQTQALVLSEVMGFCVFDANAVKTLTVNA